MRSFFAAPVFAAGLAAALPAAKPQDIDFAMVYAAPNPTYTQVVGATAQAVTYDTAAIVASATQVSSVSIAETDVASSTALEKRGATCTTNLSGATGAPTVSPDTVSAFSNNVGFSSSALAAPVPTGYSQTFQNLNASNNAYGYLGFTTLQKYDTNTCAAKCNAINGCMAFNLYFERDPSMTPATGCTNPASVTLIKCVFWGGPVSTTNANNYGQTEESFQVVIAGSNGYVNNTLVPPTGYTDATYLGSSAINAPLDSDGYDTYMGSTIFNSGPFNASLCAEHCTAQSVYNLANPPTDGSPVQTCQFFNTYILYINTTKDLQGQYCALYSETWSSSYATNNGQYSGNDHFLIEYSYTFSNKTNPATTPNKNGAIHQASKDISYSTLQGYCSTLLGVGPATVTATSTSYVTPVSTIISSSIAVSTSTSVTTPLTTQTSFETDLSTATSVIAADAVTVTSFTSTVTDIAANNKRAVSSSTPNALTKYPASIISSACMLQVTKASSTNTVTATVTSTASASTFTSFFTTSSTTVAVSTADASTVLETDVVSTTTTLTSSAAASTITVFAVATA